MAKWRRRANVRGVSFIISSASEDEGLTFEASASWSNRPVTTKGERSKRQLLYLFTVEVWPSSTRLIPNFRVSIPQQRAAPQFPYNLQRSFVYKKCTQPDHVDMVDKSECGWMHMNASFFCSPFGYVLHREINPFIFFLFFKFRMFGNTTMDGDIVRFLWSREMKKSTSARCQTSPQGARQTPAGERPWSKPIAFVYAHLKVRGFLRQPWGSLSKRPLLHANFNSNFN